MTDFCRSCQMPILWALTEKNRRMPLDPKPHQNGNVMLLANGRARVLAKDKIEPHMVLYMPHHASCPAGRQWKGKRRRAAAPS